MNKKIQEFCKNYNLTIDQFYGKEKYEGYLDLDSLTSIPEGFNPTVGGYLNLSSLTSIPEGFNPTAGGYLDLRSLTSIPEGFNPTVGGSLDLKNESKRIQNIPSSYIFTWQSGKYIKVDGMFTEVISKKGNVYKVKEINREKVFYIVTNGSTHAHGDTIKEAKNNLIYKITDRDKSKYGKLKLSDTLCLEEMIECYRVITGACETGVKMFLQDKKVKKKYSIQEVIDMTMNQYGNKEFEQYFNV